MTTNERHPQAASWLTRDRFENDDVHLYLGKDVHGRWVWQVRFYTIGSVSALTLQTERGPAIVHLRHNLRRMAAALMEIEKEIGGDV